MKVVLWHLGDQIPAEMNIEIQQLLKQQESQKMKQYEVKSTKERENMKVNLLTLISF